MQLKPSAVPGGRRRSKADQRRGNFHISGGLAEQLLVHYQDSKSLTEYPTASIGVVRAFPVCHFHLQESTWH